MHQNTYKYLTKTDKPIEVIVVGLGFMGFGFTSVTRNIPGIHVALLISRRPKESAKYLKEHGFEKVKVQSNPEKIKDFSLKGGISVSDDLDLIEKYENKVVIEMTGTVDYGTEVGLKALNAGKHLVTMNPELQETVGTELKKIADKKGLVITDVLGDQPGSLIRLVTHAKMMGFKILVAGNMKRYMDRHANQIQMKPWADDKGLAVRQTVSFTDGSKQSIEMALVSNYLGMDVLEFGMRGPQVDDIKEVLTKFDWKNIPENGIVDYVIGKNLFPGIFVVCEHKDPNQQKYLRYLGLGEGPRYVLFEPYHLCHLEVAETIVNAVLNNEPTINNGDNPKAKTIAVAKQSLNPGDVLDGIGGDLVYGNIDRFDSADGYLPMGLSHGAKVKVHLHQDQPIKLNDVEIADNAAAKLLGLVRKKEETIKKIVRPINFLGF